MPRLRIPFESLDPLTIGASGDETKVNREELELDVPDRNLLAAVYPEEPQPVGVGHRAEDRPGQPRPPRAARDPVPPERAEERRGLHVRRRLLPRHAGLAP